jgi:hypothetical protein
MNSQVAIAKVEPTSADEWNRVWGACDYSTFFHAPEWIEIWHRFKRGQVVAAPRTVIFEDQKRAVLPVATNRRGMGLLTTLTSAMEGTFGGWISTDELGLPHALALAAYLLKDSGGNVSWRLSPYCPFAAEIREYVKAHSGSVEMAGTKKDKVISCMRNWQLPLLIDDNTHAINLSPGFSALFGSQSSSVRKAKKARKAGVEVKLAETEAEWREYYQVYLSSVERWGEVIPYPWELFAEMFGMRSAKINLWLATLDSRIVSGALCFSSRKHVVYWHGSSLEQYFELRPVNLLMLEIIKHTAEQGCTWYDFNPSGSLTGVMAFKESFGAKPLPCPLIYVDTHIKRAARATLLGMRGYL